MTILRIPLLLAATTLSTLSLNAQVKVDVTPESVRVEPSASQQFTSAVTGSTNTDVAWSRDPVVGDIDPNTGVYTAPRVPRGCDAETVDIIATSKANRSVSGKATVTLPADPVTRDDCRENFEASFYLGFGIDTFAANEFRQYANPNDAGGVSERGVGGIDFAYRLGRFGKSKHVQLWVFGETVHGVRSTDVDCSNPDNKDFFICKNTFGQPAAPADELLRIIRNATSLEGFGGARLEFLTLNIGDDHAANVYLKGQAGFLKVAQRPGDAVDIHHVGLGAIVTKGHFQSSYLEVGLGRTDLFIDPDRAARKWNRKKIDGFLSAKIGGPVRFFAQLLVDSDFGPGSDSVQTYIGLEFDLRRFNFRP